MQAFKAGLLKTSLIDYPGEVSAVVFTPGCNLRCPYCHNPEFVFSPPEEELLDGREISYFLKKRKDVLGALVISGGEPLLHSWTPELAEEAFVLGYKVKIDTNGFFPAALKKIKASYIAMDLKTLPAKYGLLSGTAAKPDTAALLESLAWLKTSGIPHELRMTLVPGIVGTEDLEQLAALCKGADRLIIAPFRNTSCLNPDYEKKLPYSAEETAAFAQAFKAAGINCSVRGMN